MGFERTVTLVAAAFYFFIDLGMPSQCEMANLDVSSSTGGPFMHNINAPTVVWIPHIVHCEWNCTNSHSFCSPIATELMTMFGRAATSSPSPMNRAPGTRPDQVLPPLSCFLENCFISLQPMLLFRDFVNEFITSHSATYYSSLHLFWLCITLVLVT